MIYISFIRIVSYTEIKYIILIERKQIKNKPMSFHIKKSFLKALSNLSKSKPEYNEGQTVCSFHYN